MKRFPALWRHDPCKGSNLSGFDPDTGSIERFSNPRHQKWHEHLEFRGPVIVGLTSVGRTTVKVLGMNEERRVQLRADLLARGEFFG